MNIGTIRSLARKHGRNWSLFSFYGPMLSAAIADGNNSSTETVMKSAIESGISFKQVDEVILQSHLFLGFPAMIEAARILADVRGKKNASIHLPGQYSNIQCKKWNQNGIKKMRRIYGPSFDSLVSYINSFSPQILGWMVNDGYGRVLSRPGISFDQRELCIVAILTVTGYQNQLRAHLRGAINVGLEIELIATVIDNCHYFCSAKNIKKSKKLLKRTCAA